MPAPPLTARRAEILSAIIEWYERTRRTPSLTDLGGFGEAAARMMNHLQTLHRQGYIELGATRSGRRRRMRILRRPDGSPYARRCHDCGTICHRYTRCSDCLAKKREKEGRRRAALRDKKRCLVCTAAVAAGRRYCNTHLAYYRKRAAEYAR